MSVQAQWLHAVAPDIGWRIYVIHGFAVVAGRELAAANGVILWDRPVLVRELAQATVMEPPLLDRQLQW